MKIESQKYMGRGQLINRLASQVGSVSLAVGLLKKRGHLTNDGRLTELGKKRDQMTAEERAIDRASKASKYGAEMYKYNPIKNRATLK